MKTLTAGIALVLGLFFSPVCSAYSTYTYTITGSTSQVVIAASNWNPGSPHYAIMVYDSSGHRLSTTLFSGSIDSSTYDATINFSPSVSSGSIVLTGPFSSLTTASTDFQVAGTGAATLTVCGACSPSSPAVRSDGVKTYAMGHTYSVTMYTGGASSVRAYLDTNGFLTFGVSSLTSNAACTPSTDCAVVIGQYAYPSGVVPLGHATWNSGGSGVFGAVTDDRLTSFQ